MRVMRFFFFYTILLFRQVHQEEEFAGGNLSVSRSGSQSLNYSTKRLISLVEQKTQISFNLRLNNLPEATIIKALHRSCFG